MSKKRKLRKIQKNIKKQIFEFEDALKEFKTSEDFNHKEIRKYQKFSKFLLKKSNSISDELVKESEATEIMKEFANIESVDIWANIFSFVKLKTLLLRCCLVCKFWKSIIYHHPTCISNYLFYKEEIFASFRFIMLLESEFLKNRYGNLLKLSLNNGSFYYFQNYNVKFPKVRKIYLYGKKNSFDLNLLSHIFPMMKAIVFLKYTSRYTPYLKEFLSNKKLKSLEFTHSVGKYTHAVNSLKKSKGYFVLLVVLSENLTKIILKNDLTYLEALLLFSRSKILRYADIVINLRGGGIQLGRGRATNLSSEDNKEREEIYEEAKGAILLYQTNSSALKLKSLRTLILRIGDNMYHMGPNGNVGKVLQVFLHQKKNRLLRFEIRTKLGELYTEGISGLISKVIKRNKFSLKKIRIDTRMKTSDLKFIKKVEKLTSFSICVDKRAYEKSLRKFLKGNGSDLVYLRLKLLRSCEFFNHASWLERFKVVKYLILTLRNEVCLDISRMSGLEKVKICSNFKHINLVTISNSKVRKVKVVGKFRNVCLDCLSLRTLDVRKLEGNQLVETKNSPLLEKFLSAGPSYSIKQIVFGKSVKKLKFFVLPYSVTNVRTPEDERLCFGSLVVNFEILSRSFDRNIKTLKSYQNQFSTDRINYNPRNPEKYMDSLSNFPYLTYTTLVGVVFSKETPTGFVRRLKRMKILKLVYCKNIPWTYFTQLFPKLETLLEKKCVYDRDRVLSIMKDDSKFKSLVGLHLLSPQGRNSLLAKFMNARKDLKYFSFNFDGSNVVDIGEISHDSLEYLELDSKFFVTGGKVQKFSLNIPKIKNLKLNYSVTLNSLDFKCSMRVVKDLISSLKVLCLYYDRRTVDDLGQLVTTLEGSANHCKLILVTRYVKLRDDEYQLIYKVLKDVFKKVIIGSHWVGNDHGNEFIKFDAFGFTYGFGRFY